MSWDHFRAIVWLRARLARRRFRRAGALSGAIWGLLSIILAVCATAGFALALFLGVRLLPRAEPDHLLVLWNVAAAAFLLSWIVGLMTDLQRSDTLSLAKLLHLPLSLREVFLLNYLSSFLNFSLILLGPILLGLCLASVIVMGPLQLLLLPLLAATLVLLTSVTYQFRGWLESIMENKRRRSTVIALMTACLVLVANSPNFVNLHYQRQEHMRKRAHDERLAEIRTESERSGVVEAEVEARIAELEKIFSEERDERRAATFGRVLRVVRIADRVFPPGWLAYGAWSAAGGRPLPAVLGTLGALLLSGLSLRRSFRKSLAQYRGEASARRLRRPPIQEKQRPRNRAPKTDLLRRSLPFVSPDASAVAFATLRVLLRAPVFRMQLLSVLFVLAMMVGLLVNGRALSLPTALALLPALGLVALVMLTLSKAMQNVFGFDGDGFRVYLLSAVGRSDILLGKNLAMAPFALALSAVAIVAVAAFSAPAPSHVLGVSIQALVIYLLCCLLGNLGSILAPMGMEPGTMKVTNREAGTIVKQIGFALLVPLALLPAALALGTEALLEALEMGLGVSPFLVLSLVELPLALWLYRSVLGAEGELLERRQLRVLEVVRAQAD